MGRKTVGVGPPNPDPDNVPSDSHEGADEPTHATGTPAVPPRWLRTAIENSSEIVTIVDPDGTLRYASPAFGRMLGYDPDEAVGTMNVLDQVHLDDLPLVLEETEKALSEGGIVSNKVEYRFRHADGSWRWIESVGTYLLDDPHVGGVVITSRDVTERRQSEEALRKSEAEVFSILESITDAFFALDRNWRFVYVNRSAEVLFSTRREDLIGQRIWKDPTFYPQYRRAIAEHTTARFEAYYPNSKAWYSVRAYPSGEGLSVYLQDITERKQAEDKLRFQSRLLDTVGQAVIATDVEGEVLYWNRAAEELYGFSAQEAIGRNLSELVVSEETREKAAEIRAKLREGKSWSGEMVLRHKDGTTFPVMDTATPVFDDNNELIGSIGVSTDITEPKEAEQSLKESEERYRTLVEHIPVITYLQELASPRRTTYLSPQYENILGYSVEEDLSDPEHWIKILHPEDRERVLAEDKRTDETGDPFVMEYRQIASDGSVVWIRDEAKLVRDSESNPLYWLGVQTDITERRRIEERLKRQTLHDALTRLPNRKMFMGRLRHALERTRRRRDRKVAVLFMDLDGFKVINDSLGHETGDLLLTVVAQRLRNSLRPEDTLARFGGDEFVVLVEDVESPDDAVRVASRITEELRRPFVVEGRDLFAPASVGIALGDARTKSPEELLRDADTAMYKAKDEHAAYTVFDHDMYERAVRRLELENELRLAIEGEEFVVHYQPIVDLDKGEVRGVEALVRWNHPKRGLLGPDVFVPVAEESGLVVPIGKWVLEDACRNVKEWQRGCPHTTPLFVSVNLSAKQLARPDVAQTIDEALKKTGLEAIYLALDVTETAYVKTLEGDRDTLDRIRGRGVNVSIDDFGVGYSSLSYLKHLPADVLKIDKSFVAGLGEEVEDTTVVRVVIELAHTFGMKVIAEGVETWAQAALLAEMGCDFAQGYYFSVPLPFEEVPRALAG